MFQNRFDQFYLTICKETGGIEGLLKSFFDFMIRKTDFFYECDPGDKMGFPPGYSRKLLLSIFEKFQEEHYKRFPKKDAAAFQSKMKKYQEQKNKTKQNPPEPKTTQIKNESKQEKVLQKQQKMVQEQVKVENQEKITKNEEKSQENAPKLSSNVQPIIDTYNGGKNDKYSWSQQSHDVEVTIELQADITAKMITVDFKTDRISIKKKTGQTIISGELYEAINAADSMWKIERNKGRCYLTLNLEKAQDKIWSTVFKGDPEIDTTKVNNTKPLHEFDDETQGAIRKIMHEQQRKQMGLPTTEEEKQLEGLKKAWDAEGSPFKGQPFDASKFNLQGSDFKLD